MFQSSKNRDLETIADQTIVFAQMLTRNERNSQRWIVTHKTVYFEESVEYRVETWDASQYWRVEFVDDKGCISVRIDGNMVFPILSMNIWDTSFYNILADNTCRIPIMIANVIDTSLERMDGYKKEG